MQQTGEGAQVQIPVLSFLLELFLLQGAKKGINFTQIRFVCTEVLTCQQFAGCMAQIREFEKLLDIYLSVSVYLSACLNLFLSLTICTSVNPITGTDFIWMFIEDLRSTA